MRRRFVTIGALLIAGGVAGFLQNPLLGLFAVNTAHNLVHAGSGVLTILVAPYGIGPMRACGKALGFFYLGLAIAGFLLPGGDMFGAMPLNTPDNLLHLGLAWIFLYYGLLAPPRI
jgi:hypothetical protein